MTVAHPKYNKAPVPHLVRQDLGDTDEIIL